MNPKQISIFIVDCILLFGIQACTLLIDTPPSTEVEVTSITKPASPLPTNTKRMTATSLPTSDSETPLAFGDVAIPTSTLEPPPIPDFEKVLTYGGGGGAIECFPGQQGEIRVCEQPPGIARIGIWADVRFPLELEWISSTGAIFASNTLLQDDQNKWYWQEYPDFVRKDNYPGFINVMFSWPINHLPSGQWRVNVYSGNFAVSTDFSVSQETDLPTLAALDPYSVIQPVYEAPPWVHPLRLRENKSVNIVGTNYPANTPIYLLVYHGYQELNLISTKVVVSDSQGSFDSKLSGLFEVGQAFLVIGISDPNTELLDPDSYNGNVFNFALPHDHFKIVPLDVASSKIDEKYKALGGVRSVLGNPSGPEQNTSDGNGRFRDFQYGSIYWTSETGAYEVHGAIRARWIEFGAEKSFLGYPTTDELTTPDGVGRYNHFQNGSIYWTPDTGAYEVHGLIRGKWAELGWEKSILGYPITDELTTPDGIGRYNHFQFGSIYWTPDTGAYEVHGLIRELWADLGWEKSCLGYPISDEEPSSEGWSRQSRFQYGIITWSSEKGTQHTCYGN